jgi:hypothetical protein
LSVRRNWLLVAIVVGIAAIVLAAVLVTEDDSGSVDTAAWADSVCSDLVDWRSSITALADVSGGTLTSESLREKLDEAQTATEDLIAELRDLGPPDLESGDELEQQLDSAADGLESSYESLASQAQDAADAETPAAFLQALAALAPQSQSFLDQIQSTATDLQNADVSEDAKAELEQAFSESESCQALTAES